MLSVFCYRVTRLDERVRRCAEGDFGRELGIGFKALFVHRFQKLSTLVYVLMGWLCVIAWKEALGAIPTGGLILVAAGGMIYTAGVIFYIWKKLPYSHAIWHVFVLGGSLCHYFAVLLYLLPTT